MFSRPSFLKCIACLLGVMLYQVMLHGSSGGGSLSAKPNQHTPSYQKAWPSNGKLISLKPRIDGHVQLFVISSHQWQKHPKNAKRYLQKHHIRKKLCYYSLPTSTKLHAITRFNYKEKLKTMMADCPQLVRQLGQKHFRFKNIESIFAYYNRLCER